MKARATRETRKAPKPKGRSVAEWFGKTDDARPPKAVRLRVFAAHDGRCHWSKLKIQVGDEWDLDHIVALEDGGANRETNLAPILRDKHRQKTGAENSRRDKADRVRLKHLGQWPEPVRKLKGRGFAPSRKQGASQ
jgi:5-methylcytosine-specific restriction protein A